MKKKVSMDKTVTKLKNSENLKNEIEPKFACQSCNEEFQEKQKLRKHVSAKHEKNFKCDQCEKNLAPNKI